MMWQGLFVVMVFVSASLGYIAWGALKYGRKLEDELAEARRYSVRRGASIPWEAVEQELQAQWNDEMEKIRNNVVSSRVKNALGPSNGSSVVVPLHVEEAFPEGNT
jgi:hypothetical protein